MRPAILGISGSPIENGNTDRLIKTILEATGLHAEFVKLSRLNVRPCMACKGCVGDNRCKVDDDFPELADKIRDAGALIIGGYIPYGQIDGFTKAFLERLWSLHHRKSLLSGKLGVTVLSGVDKTVLDATAKALAAELRNLEHMELVGQLTIGGNLPCFTCGEMAHCPTSGARRRCGSDALKMEGTYFRVEDQQDLWDEAQRLGRLIGERLS